MMRVVKIQDHHLVKAYMTPSRHLPKPRAAREHVQAAALPRPVKVPLVWEARPWTDKTHVTPDYVPELWQLIERQGAKPSTDARDSRVLRQLVDFGAVLGHGRGRSVSDVVAE